MAKHQVKLHPVVDAYIHTGKLLGDILLAAPEPKDPVTKATICLRDVVFGERTAEDAFALAEAADTSGADPDLLVLFYTLWAHLSMGHERYAEAASLNERAKALIGAHSPSEIRAELAMKEAELLAHIGRKEEADTRFVQALAMVPKGSPRYPGFLLERANKLAQSGRGAEIEAEYSLLFAKGRVSDEWHKLFGLVHYAETGRLEDAAACLAAIQTGPGARRQTKHCTFYGTLLAVLQGRGEGDLPDWAVVVRELLAGRSEQALHYARRAARDSSGFLYGVQFQQFNMIRAELANGQAEAARRLIRLRREMGNKHYLDDFFLARVELLSGNREEAQRRFASTYRACQRYQAEKRLEIELRLACELSRAEVMFLMAGIGKAEPEGLPGKASQPKAEPPSVSGTGRLIGISPAMAELRRTVKQIAALEAPVLITGETGTGKELAARAIHESGPRAAGPFLALNCGAIAESLLESELFGHEKGAFTGAAAAHRGLFEEAGSGTILLDEIGEISPRLQVSLLRVLESGEIRPVGSARSRRIGCRIIAATNAELNGLAERSAFRKDLLYRLKRLEVHIPPLRERREDILPLAELFLAEGRSDGLRPLLSAELRAELMRRDWPGNARELRNEMERMRLLNSDRLEYGLAELAGGKAAPGPALAPPASGGAGPNRGCTRLGRLELVRELFRSRRRLARSEVIRALGISQATATAYLKILCDEGLIEKVAPTAAPRTHYFQLKIRA